MRRLALIAALILAAILTTGPAFAQVSGVTFNASTGIILLGDGLVNCHAADTGGIRYNSTTGFMQSCNGTTWSTIGSGAGAGSVANLILGGPAETVVTTADFYQLTGPVTLETTSAARADQPVVVAGTFKNFCVTMGTANGAGGTFTATLFQNNGASAVTVTVAANAAAGSVTCDSTHSVTFAANDLAAVAITGTTSTGKVSGWSIEFDPTSGIAGSTGAISGLAAAVGTNAIDNLNYAQTWNWNTLAGTNALTLASTSTAAASNAQTLLNIALSGANGTTTQTTYGEQISNTHTGTSSTNIGLYATASGGTNNYAAIFNAGNVGIGTTSPSSQLANTSTNYIDTSGNGNSGTAITWQTVNGGYVAEFVNTAASGGPTNGVLIQTPNATTSSDKPLKIETGGISRFLVRGDGNVGIGSTSPAKKLEVDGVTGNPTDGTGTTGITRFQATDDNVVLDTGAITASPWTYWLQVGDNGAPYLYPLALNPQGGNVGIGTTTPGALFHVNLPTQTTATVNSLLISRWTRPQTGGVKWGNSMDMLLGSYGTSINSQSRVDFKLADGATDLPDTTVMTLQGNGNVGIGTTTPGAKLDVGASDNFVVTASLYGNTNYTVAVEGISYTTTAGLTAGVQGQNQSTTNGQGVNGSDTGAGNYGAGVDAQNLGTGNTGYALQATNNSATGWGLYADGTSPNYFKGNVGIGTTSPAATLDVSGGSTSILVGADSGASTRTNATDKTAKIAAPSYNSGTKAPYLLMEGVTSGGSQDNDIYIGGGDGAFNTATNIYFFVAGLSDTLNGTQAININAGGNVEIGTSGVVDARFDVLPSGNTTHALIDNFTCGAGFAGLGFGTSATSCNYYSILGDNTSTYVNAPSGTIYFRKANNNEMVLASSGHLDFTGTVPAISACGTSPPAATGTDNAFQLTTGTAAPTNCTATFATAWANTPFCIAQEFNGVVVVDLTAASTTAITIHFASGLTSKQINVICRGWE